MSPHRLSRLRAAASFVLFTSACLATLGMLENPWWGALALPSVVACGLMIKRQRDR